MRSRSTPSLLASPEPAHGAFAVRHTGRRQRAMHIAYPILRGHSHHGLTGEIPALLLELRRRTASPATAKKEHDRRASFVVWSGGKYAGAVGYRPLSCTPPLRTFSRTAKFFGWATRSMATRIKL